MLRSLLREALLFVACATFTAIVGLVLIDTVIMPYYVRQGRQVVVPDIVNLSQPQARRDLARAGLRLSMQEGRWDADVPEGRIAAQAPPARARVKSGRTVYAVPSLGQRLCKVPNVQGQSLRQAQLWIQQKGLAMGRVSEEASPEVSEGLVVRQDPLPGQEVNAGAEVSLVVSTGAPRDSVTVPNFVGKDLESVRSGLAALDLDVGEIRYEFSTAYLPNTVIQHVPGAGESVKRGTGVRLVVSKL